MPDSQLNGPEQALQHIFRKSSKFSHVFNGLIVGFATVACSLLIDELPDHLPLPPAVAALDVRPIELESISGPFKLGGAWELRTNDPRFGGISALALDQGRFLAVTDRGAVARFDLPDAKIPKAWLADLRKGPGPFARKWARDAESLARDPLSHGWWVGYEQRHSLWLYDDAFVKALTSVDLGSAKWRDNRGAEGLAIGDGELLAVGENGRDVIRIRRDELQPLPLYSDADVAEAAAAPDGSIWVLLRDKHLRGIEQSIAPLLKTHDGFRVGPGWQVPKGALDNYEGMAITQRPDGRWRFWLITDDGHRVMARTLLVALDLALPVRHDKSPAWGAGLSKKASVNAP